MFEPLPAQFDFPAAEKRVRDFWERHDIFGRSLKIRTNAPSFVFYEGPPTANGMPHPGHALTRAIKDLFPRYRTMRGQRVERKAGWDTHGLPVEVEVCKEIGIHTKEEIEAYGVERFVRRCIDSVFRYTREWEEMTRRLGFWVNLDEAYVTYHQSYVESVWWSLKTLFERGLLYQGHKVVWWWPQGGTALSAGEVGEGYRPVDDPSVFVRFPLRDPLAAISPAPDAQRTSLLVWTTTPWTLLSNHFAAVHPDVEYALVHDPVDGERLVIAAALVETVAKKVRRELNVIATLSGASLIGLRYAPPFEDYSMRTSLAPGIPEGPPLRDRRAALRDGGDAPIGWRVLAADFVTLDSGTGLVHEAPAFGEVDFDLLQQERRRFVEPEAIPLLCAVRPDGTFSDEAPPAYRGRWIKDCDKEIARELKDRGLLYHQEQYRHDYPFSPRAENDPLIQYARMSWFVRTSRFKDEFLANNALVHWLPEHIREGRFGDFLRNNVDWALSRERYWGTPLPIWVCETTGRMEAVGAFAELVAKPGATDGGFWSHKRSEDPTLPEHLKVHKPYIDEWTYDSPYQAGARMRRVREVIDVWWDAGSMPFAQWGYPHVPGSEALLAMRYPADFISEAIDQTRGWFYALLAINTLLFGPPAAAEPTRDGKRPPSDYPMPFRNCIVLGHMMGEDGAKMSKRLKNYREPAYIFDKYGADAMRWYFFSAQVPWTTARFQEQNIRDAHREFLVRLYNVFSFLVIYGNIDAFEPGAHARPVAQRSELDRWIVSELHRTIRVVRENLDRFENFPAARRINDFVDALSNWYVRRSRPRFWAHEKTQDKWDAYETLHECLLATSQLIAPFTPFFAETLWQTLTGSAYDGPGAGRFAGSVHLSDFPEADAALIDEPLAELMDQVRDLVSAGRAARAAAKLKIRQPLARAEIVVPRLDQAARLRTHVALVLEELNLKEVEFTTDGDQYVTYQVKPDLKRLGPRLGKLLPKVTAALAAADPAELRRRLTDEGRITLEIDGQSTTLDEQEVFVRLEAKAGWSAAPGRSGVVVVATELSAELLDEGQVRELIHHVQAERKEQNLPYEARIALRLSAPDALTSLVRRWESTIATECLVGRFEYDPPGDGGKVVDVEGTEARLGIEQVEV